MNTNDLPAVKHPFTQYTLADVVALATDNAKSFGHQAPRTLEEVREYIKSMADQAGFVWLTGLAALDILDAAIEGTEVDIEKCRFR